MAGLGVRLLDAYANLRRYGVDADAIGIAAYTTVGGVVGAKLWHVLEDPTLLVHQPLVVLFDRAGFAWFGGLLAGIAVLVWWAGKQDGGLGDARPCSPGRCGWLRGRTSGLPDFGRWGLRYTHPAALGHEFPHGLVPTDQRVHPTPIYEFLVAVLIALYLWRRGAKKMAAPLPLGQLTGEYLVLSGVARFLVEFIRINPRIYWGMSNAQVASAGSIVAGLLLILWARRHGVGRRGAGPVEVASQHRAPSGD